ncbi:hypothetical protein C1645_827464 [Glomus cerebriforme]|uniref:Uncharacterized protein n=1 Tax=Glomus cerebriforme TaxID=658196 RepID=A0A397SNV1_9GLOM|nr:hypothetical protein C1645_827464 [Glomus cerebriforme]
MGGGSSNGSSPVAAVYFSHLNLKSVTFNRRLNLVLEIEKQIGLFFNFGLEIWFVSELGKLKYSALRIWDWNCKFGSGNLESEKKHKFGSENSESEKKHSVLEIQDWKLKFYSALGIQNWNHSALEIQNWKRNFTSET